MRRRLTCCWLCSLCCSCILSWLGARGTPGRSAMPMFPGKAPRGEQKLMLCCCGRLTSCGNCEEPRGNCGWYAGSLGSMGMGVEGRGWAGYCWDRGSRQPPWGNDNNTIRRDPSHPTNSLFTPFPSGKRFWDIQSTITTKPCHFICSSQYPWQPLHVNQAPNYPKILTLVCPFAVCCLHALSCTPAYLHFIIR